MNKQNRKLFFREKPPLSWPLYLDRHKHLADWQQAGLKLCIILLPVFPHCRPGGLRGEHENKKNRNIFSWNCNCGKWLYQTASLSLKGIFTKFNPNWSQCVVTGEWHYLVRHHLLGVGVPPLPAVGQSPEGAPQSRLKGGTRESQSLQDKSKFG